MSGKRIHTIRSHRSMRAYKPVCKAVAHKEAKARKRFSRFIRGMLQEKR